MRTIVFTTLILCLSVIYMPEPQVLKIEKPAKAEAATRAKIQVIEEALQRIEEGSLYVEKADDTVEQEKETEKTEKKIPVATQSRPSPEEKRRRQLIEKKRKQLDNTEWEIELTLLGGKGLKQGRGVKQKDTITFKNNQVISAGFSQRGFSATNYTLSIEKDENMVWETMQTSEKNGVAFWRGEIDLSMAKMNGIISHQVDDKTTRDYSFLSTGKKAIRP